MNKHCPRCGQPQRLHSQYRLYQEHLSESPVALPTNLPANISSAYRRTPFRSMEFGADVVVPLGQALVAGVMFTGAAWVFTPVFGWTWYMAPCGGIIIAGLAWWRQVGVSAQTLWVEEEITGAAPVAQPAAAEVETTHITVSIDGGRRTVIDELPGDDDLRRFAAAVVRGETFSERTAKSARYPRDSFRELRTKFLERGWCRWRDERHPQQGIELLDEGRQVLEALATGENN